MPKQNNKMNTITNFLTENKKTIFIISVILFCILSFFGGLYLEKNINSNRELKSKEKEIKTEIGQINKKVESSSENANLFIDSMNFYKSAAEKENNKSIQLKNKIEIINKENEKNISYINNLSDDSNVVLFSILAKEYNSN